MSGPCIFHSRQQVQTPDCRLLPLFQSQIPLSSCVSHSSTNTSFSLITPSASVGTSLRHISPASITVFGRRPTDRRCAELDPLPHSRLAVLQANTPIPFARRYLFPSTTTRSLPSTWQQRHSHTRAACGFRSPIDRTSTLPPPTTVTTNGVPTLFRLHHNPTSLGMNKWYLHYERSLKQNPKISANASLA